MTDRRERIALFFFDYVTEIERSPATKPIDCYHFADAVLAALADDLLPELPDGWWHMDFRKSDGGQEFVNQPAIPEGHVYFRLYDDAQDPSEFAGTGPTIPAAIRNALKE